MGDYIRSWADGMDVRKNEAFILIPFDEAFDPVLSSIQNVCEELKIKPKRADDIKQGLIMNNIFDGINHSEIIIADITGNNPNVFLELGIALSRRENVVIVISQDRDDAPFDIRNWQVLQYKIDQLDTFRKDLFSRIQLVRNRFGTEQLRSLLSASSPSDKSLIDPFFKKIEEKDDENNRRMNNICYLLSGSSEIEGSQKSFISDLNMFLVGLADEEDEKYKEVANYLRVLVFSSPFTLTSFFSEINEVFLSEWKVDPVTMKELPHREITSKICFRIIDMDHPKKEVAIKWLIHYLENKRMGRIDPVRASIAGYLISSKDKQVDNAILNLLETSNAGVLESAIDICGQKQLWAASDRILTIMKRAKDPFVVRSSIYALSRLGNKNAAEAIYTWMLTNRDKWGEQAVSANLRNNALDALKEMDKEYYHKMLSL